MSAHWYITDSCSVYVDPPPPPGQFPAWEDVVILVSKTEETAALVKPSPW